MPFANRKEQIIARNFSQDNFTHNSLKEAGAGFGVDTNILTLIREDKEEKLPLLSKEAASNILLDRLFSLSD